MHLITQVVVAICLSLAVLGQGAPNENKSAPHEQKDGGANSSRPPNQAVPSRPTESIPKDESVSSNERQNNTYYYQQPANGKSSWVLIGINALYVIVSLLTFFAIYKQAKHMREGIDLTKDQLGLMREQVGKMEGQLAEMGRQTTATQNAADAANKAADAAKTQADAIMLGERAWLLVEDITADAINFIRAPQFSFRVVNYGRTPAQVHGYRAYCQISASDEIPDDRSFMEGSGGRGDDPIVPPNGEPLKISSTDMWPAFAIYPTQAEVEKIATNPPELYLWACGYVSYWDVFGKDAQEVKDLKITPFAMVYRASQAKLMRPTFPFLNRPT
jgi:hypothetical protein